MELPEFAFKAVPVVSTLTSNFPGLRTGLKVSERVDAAYTASTLSEKLSGVLIQVGYLHCKQPTPRLLQLLVHPKSIKP